MSYEASEKALYNQLLYFRGLWNVDVDGAKDKGANLKVEGGATGDDERDGGDSNSSAEKVRAVAEWNRERFGTCAGVVEGYLRRCGRVWVQMDELFGFALGK